MNKESLLSITVFPSSVEHTCFLMGALSYAQVLHYGLCAPSPTAYWSLAKPGHWVQDFFPPKTLQSLQVLDPNPGMKNIQRKLCIRVNPVWPLHQFSRWRGLTPALGIIDNCMCAISSRKAIWCNIKTVHTRTDVWLCNSVYLYQYIKTQGSLRCIKLYVRHTVVRHVMI